MPKNKMDNPKIKPEKPSVQSPRSFKGSDFKDFPRLVVQINRPRPRPQRPVREEPNEQTGEPSEGFARPVRGMGLGAYEGGREQFQPQIDSYRTALHSAYADNTLSDSERKGLRQQRRGLRQDVRQYKRQNPLQMGLGSRVKEMAQGDREGGIGEQVKEMAQPSDVPKPSRVGQLQSLKKIMPLIQQFKNGQITEEELYEAMGLPVPDKDYLRKSILRGGSIG